MPENKEKNDVVFIELDRPRMLHFGHKAIKQMLKLTGKNLDSIDTEKLDLEEIEKVMYCGLLRDAKDHNEDLKLEDMEDILDQAPNYGEVVGKMTKALEVAFGDFGDLPAEKNLKGIAVAAQQKNGAGKNH